MTIRWLRELRAYEFEAIGSLRFYNKAFAMFLRYCCGWTFVDQSVSAGTDYLSYEKSGTGGVFSGSDFVLSDVAATFVNSDVPKWVLIHDPNSAKARNDGIYRIENFISSSQIKIDFRSDYNEFPTASSSLQWYIFSSSYQLPTYLVGTTAWWTLQSPHVSGWQLRGSYYRDTYWNNNFLYLEVAPTGDWNKKLSYVIHAEHEHCTGDVAGVRHTWFSVVTDDNGEWVFPFTYYGPGNGSDGAYINQFVGAKASRIIPVHSGHSEQELMALQGSWTAADYGPAIYRNYTWTGGRQTMGWCYVWSDRRNVQYQAPMMVPTSGNYSNAFQAYTGKELNWRVGWNQNVKLGRNEIMNLDYPFLVDVDGTSDNYQMVGRLQGNYCINTRNGLIKPGQLMSSDGIKKDRLHLQSGFVIDWPEVTPRFGE